MTKKLKYQINKEGSAKWTIEKELSDFVKNKMDDGNVEAFDGISLIEWTPDDKIALLKEFGCNENRYDPYKDGTIPHFRDENAKWF